MNPIWSQKFSECEIFTVLKTSISFGVNKYWVRENVELELGLGRVRVRITNMYGLGLGLRRGLGLGEEMYMG